MIQLLTTNFSVSTRGQGDVTGQTGGGERAAAFLDCLVSADEDLALANPHAAAPAEVEVPRESQEQAAPGPLEGLDAPQTPALEAVSPPAVTPQIVSPQAVAPGPGDAEHGEEPRSSEPDLQDNLVPQIHAPHGDGEPEQPAPAPLVDGSQTAPLAAAIPAVQLQPLTGTQLDNDPDPASKDQLSRPVHVAAARQLIGSEAPARVQFDQIAVPVAAQQPLAAVSTEQAPAAVSHVGPGPTVSQPPVTEAQVPAPAPQRVPAAQLMDQVRGPVGQLRTAQDGEHVFSIRITPENLGPVQVRAHIGAEGIRVELVGATDAVRDQLRTMLVDLRRDLQSTGMSAQLSVSDSQQQSDRSGGQTGSTEFASSQHPKKQPGSLPAGTSLDVSGAPTPTTPTGQQAVGVDILA